MPSGQKYEMKVFKVKSNITSLFESMSKLIFIETDIQSYINTIYMVTKLENVISKVFLFEFKSSAKM